MGRGVAARDLANKLNFTLSFLPLTGQQAMVMLRLWINSAGNRATGNELEKVLHKCNREDIVRKCITQMEVINDQEEIDRAKMHILKMEDKEIIDYRVMS